jgi:uncharacterized protein YbcI
MPTPDTHSAQGLEQLGDQEQRSILMEVSNAIVQLFKEQFGRGPTKARSHWAGPDALVCILRETFTPAEKNMVALGEHQRLRDVRLFFQAATEERFREVVSAIVGRRVESFMSAVDTTTDTAMEMFIFEPDTERDEAQHP